MSILRSSQLPCFQELCYIKGDGYNMHFEEYKDMGRGMQHEIGWLDGFREKVTFEERYEKGKRSLYLCLHRLVRF